jgi:5-methylcytosine-specific restriction enzyme A
VRSGCAAAARAQYAAGGGVGMLSKASILASLEEFNVLGEAAFLKKYAGGHGSRNTWIRYSGRDYPIKAIWSSAHNPPLPTQEFTTHMAKRPLRQMGFHIVEPQDVAPKLQSSTLGRKSVSFSQFCASLGFPLKNVRWSWSALAEEDRQSLFTVWDNEIEPDGQTYEFWDGTSDEKRTDNGAREFKRILNETLDKNLTAYGVKCTPVYPLTVPRKRQTFDRSKLLALKLRRDGSKIVGTIVGTVLCDTIRTGYTSEGSAIDDLDPLPIGNQQPERTAYSGTFIVRDDRVRLAVIERANGKCEHCGELGFRKPDGTHYVEAHHIISLAEQGPDTLDNVIALCPNHHRQAHYGADCEELEAEFKIKLARIRGQ